MKRTGEKEKVLAELEKLSYVWSTSEMQEYGGNAESAPGENEYIAKNSNAIICPDAHRFNAVRDRQEGKNQHLGSPMRPVAPIHRNKFILNPFKQTLGDLGDLSGKGNLREHFCSEQIGLDFS